MGPVQKNQSTSEPSGALVWDHHATRDQAGQLLQRQGADRQDRAVCGGLQQDQDPVQLDRHSGLNPGEAPETLCANLQDGTLAPLQALGHCTYESCRQATTDTALVLTDWTATPACTNDANGGRMADTYEKCPSAS